MNGIDDIEFLVAETFKTQDAENVDAFLFEKGKDPFDLIDPTPKQQPVLNLIPETSGIIYHLQKGSSTFVVRALAFANLKQGFATLGNNEETLKSLRIEKENLGELKFFSTQNLELARQLKKQVCSRRFPIFEENMCNVSDPGFSWWLKDEGHSFSILFSLTHTDQLENLTKLGPLGDCSVANKKFQKLYGFFSSLFSLKSFSCSKSRLSLCADLSGRGCFEDIKLALVHGEFSFSLLNEIENVVKNATGENKALFQSALFYFKELVTVREFWLKIQSQLSD